MKKILYSCLLFACGLLTSCSNNPTLPTATGAAGEVLLVIDEDVFRSGIHTAAVHVHQVVQLLFEYVACLEFLCRNKRVVLVHVGVVLGNDLRTLGCQRDFCMRIQIDGCFHNFLFYNDAKC